MSKFSLSDLKPQEATFKLDAFPDKEFTLKRFSLASQMWCTETFGTERLRSMFETQHMPDIAKLCYYLLKDKTNMSYENFLENICSYQDKINLISAILTTIGLSQPVLEQMANEEAQAGNAQSLNLS